MQPLVSILFPCYNAEPYLNYSLKSILNQDYQNLEIICINDGSTDNTLAILNFHKKTDDRIVIINNQTNLGLIESLNKSLSYINGEYFARMDADDYSPQNRISTQMKFLLSNNQYDLVSTGYNYFKIDGIKREYEPPIAKSTLALMFVSLFSPPLNHASILGKTSIIKSGKYFYDKNYPYAEDFEIFSRLVWNNCKITTIKDSLYWIRLNPLSVSIVYNETQIQTNLKIVKRNLISYLNVKDSLDDITLKILANKINAVITWEQLKNSLKLLEQYYNIANERYTFNKQEKQEINKYLALHKVNIIVQSNKYRYKVLKLKNASFSVRSIGLLTISQYLILFSKLTKRLKHT